MKAAINRIKSRAGFSLSEALVALIIMLLVSSIVVAGIPAASRAYDNVVQTSNAEVLLSTAMSALRNELGTARDVEITDGGVSYYNEGFASESRLSKSDNEGIMYTRYAADAVIDNVASEPVRLVSKGTSGKSLIVTYDTVTYDPDEGLVVFGGLVVKKTSGGNATKPRDLSIRVINK